MHEARSLVRSELQRFGPLSYGGGHRRTGRPGAGKDLRVLHPDLNICVNGDFTGCLCMCRLCHTAYSHLWSFIYVFKS